MRVRRWRWLGLSLATMGAAGWAVAAAVLPDLARRSEAAALAAPDSGREGGYLAPEEWVNWVHELRWSTLVLVLCALTLAGAPAGRRALAPLAGAALAFVLANALLTFLPGGAVTAGVAFAAAVVLIGLAAGAMHEASGRSDARPTAAVAASSRDTVLVCAMLAAVVAPLPALNANVAAARSFVADELVLVTAAVQGLLAVTAVACALAAATRPTRARLVLAGVLLVAWGGALVAVGAQVYPQAAFWTIAGGGVPLVGLFGLAASAERLRPWRNWLGVGLGVAIGYPGATSLVLLSGLGSIGLFLGGGSGSADGLPALGAGIALGLCVGMAARALGHDRPRADAAARAPHAIERGLRVQ